METLKLISYYAKMITQFLAMILALLKALVDEHKRWKLIGTLSSALLLFVIGCLGIFAAHHG
jgi:hypothetical protein